MEFNLQDFLSEMRAEQREDLKTLDGKVDKALTTLQDHETRIQFVEGTRKTLRWLAASLVVAFLGAMFDFFFIHLPKMR